MSMSSPLPPDPYIALGVSKDADVSQIRTAHRKLVLKFHPDRIKGDDHEEKDKAKNEFQKVQQAYELLVDPSKRSKYDDQVRLAELVRERLMHQRSRPSQSAQSNSGPGVVRREVRRDGNLYEERAPPTSYFDERDHDRDHDRDYGRDQFDEPLPRGAARKHEAPYEKERKPSVAKATERKEKVRSRAQSPSEGISSRVASNLKAKAAQARERTREVHAKTQDIRDRERRRERSDKQSSRRNHAYVEVESESDSDTEVPRHYSRPVRPTRPEHEPRVRQRPSPVRRGAYDDEDSFDDGGEKWESHHQRGMEYINESKKRPPMQRNDSDAYVYWGGDYTGGRRSGSDTERRPASSRRTRADDARPRPSMPPHNSAPNNLRPHIIEERAPPPSRSKTGPPPSDRDRETRPPTLPRSQTMPSNRGSRKDSLPVRGSHLKQSETLDSGYYSTSSPVTPEMKGESPTPSRENSNKKKNTGPTRYQIVEPDGDSDGGASRVRPFFNSDDENRPRRTRSPEPDRRDRDRDRDRHGDRERDRGQDRARGDRSDRDRQHERSARPDSDRPRPSRQTVPSSNPRADFDRRAPNSPRGSPPPGHHRKLFAEVRAQSYDDKDSRSWSYANDQYDEKVKVSGWSRPMQNEYQSPRIRSEEPGRDYFPTSKFDEGIRHGDRRRQPTAY